MLLTKDQKNKQSSHGSIVREIADITLESVIYASHWTIFKDSVPVTVEAVVKIEVDEQTINSIKPKRVLQVTCQCL